MQLSARFKKFACVLSALALVGAYVNPLHAALVSTETVFEEAAITAERAGMLALANKEAVRAQLEALGLDADLAASRVARMTDAEVAQLQAHLDELPAGGDALGLLVFVFLVLLLTDIAGLTDIFPFVKK